MQGVVDILTICQWVSAVNFKGSWNRLGGSMLPMVKSLRSSLAFHTPSSLFGGTTHESPSGGKQPSIALPKAP